MFRPYEARRGGVAADVACHRSTNQALRVPGTRFSVSDADRLSVEWYPVSAFLQPQIRMPYTDPAIPNVYVLQGNGTRAPITIRSNVFPGALNNGPFASSTPDSGLWLA